MVLSAKLRHQTQALGLARTEQVNWFSAKVRHLDVSHNIFVVADTSETQHLNVFLFAIDMGYKTEHKGAPHNFPIKYQPSLTILS